MRLITLAIALYLLHSLEFSFRRPVSKILKERLQSEYVRPSLPKSELKSVTAHRTSAAASNALLLHLRS